jgi:cystathionine beta-lyase/cystathionine gamma-synthase
MNRSSKNLQTIAIHAGSRPNPLTGAIVEPIAQCSVYAQKSPGEFEYDYGRSMNPNYYPLEETLAALEGAKHASVASSGVGAMSMIITLVKAGDTVIIPTDLYGGTYRLFVQLFGTYGVNFIQVDMSDLDKVEDALKKGAQMLYAESPTNPLLQIYDLRELSSLAKKYGVTSIMDNTFATPVFQNPISLGFDAVLHSASKYLGGHSDIVGGVVMTNSPEIRERTDFARKSMGVHPDPLSMFLLRRGIKTLPLRMERHQENAHTVAKYLESHPLVSKVLYPGLPSHPQHEIAKKQMSGFSGMVSAEFKLNESQLHKAVSRFKVITLAESLGAVESLVQIPAAMSNKKIPAEVRKANGLSDGLVRFSIGIEAIDDILEDIEQALKN